MHHLGIETDDLDELVRRAARTAADVTATGDLAGVDIDADVTADLVRPREAFEAAAAADLDHRGGLEVDPEGAQEWYEMEGG